MWMGHELGWWGFWLAILGIILMYPIGVLINLTTPSIANVLASRTKKSLDNRIAKLERELAKLELNSPTDEVQDQILWELTNLKMRILGATNALLLLFYFSAHFFMSVKSSEFRGFTWMILLVVIADTIGMLALRYRKGFRYSRSPKVRAGLKKAIEELKVLQANWGKQVLDGGTF